MPIKTATNRRIDPSKCLREKEQIREWYRLVEPDSRASPGEGYPVIDHRKS